MTDVETIGESRRLSGPLLSGILVMPLIFAWFVLRRGYSSPVRVGAFLYTAVGLGTGILQMIDR